MALISLLQLIITLLAIGMTPTLALHGILQDLLSTDDRL